MDKEINIYELMKLDQTLQWECKRLIEGNLGGTGTGIDTKPDIVGIRRAKAAAALPLQRELDIAQGGLRARVICTDDMIETLNVYTRELGISKTAMDGITLSVNIHAGEGVHNYPYYREPESTWFDARFKAGSWRITNIYRDRCGKTRIRAVLPEKARRALVAKYERICA